MCDELITILLAQDQEERPLSVSSSHPIGPQLAGHLHPRQQLLIFGGEHLEDLEETTFEEYGIDDGARLEVHQAPRAMVTPRDEHANTPLFWCVWRGGVGD